MTITNAQLITCHPPQTLALANSPPSAEATAAAITDPNKAKSAG
ncbi:hypothetical protein [Microcoleus sp. F4-D5]